MKKTSFNRKRKAGIPRIVKRKELAELKTKKQTKPAFKKIAKIAGLIVLFFAASIVLFSAGEAMFIDASGNVGIGTTTPLEKLDVRGNVLVTGGCNAATFTAANNIVSTNGRIKDCTGFVMPVGAILPYYGETTPEGWLICNGQAIPADEKYNTLRTLCDGVVPDLRGQFLRGLDTTGTIDPTVGGRTLGSVQGDMFKSHDHTEQGPVHGGANPSAFWDTSPDGGEGISINNTSLTGGPETRPKNVAVNFIIKY